MPGKTPFYKSRPFLFVVGVSSSVFFLWLGMRGIIGDPQAMADLGRAFREADYRTLPIIFVVLFFFYWLKAWRWRLLLSPVGDYRPVKDLLSPIMIGFAFNNVLPARLGEFVRCLVFAKRSKQPLTVSISSVVLERVFDVIAVLLYLGIGLIFVPGVDPSIKTTAYILSAGSAVFVTCGLVYVLWTKTFVTIFETILKSVPFLPHWFTDKICRMLEAGAQGLESLKNVRTLIAILVISLIKWGLNASLFWLSLKSFDITVSPAVALVVMGVVAIGVAAPSAPGFFGIIQACFVGVLMVVDPNLQQSSVFAASVYYHMSQYIPVTLIGLGLAVKEGLSIKEVEAAEERLEHAIERP